MSGQKMCENTKNKTRLHADAIVLSVGAIALWLFINTVYTYVFLLENRFSLIAAMSLLSSLGCLP